MGKELSKISDPKNTALVEMSRRLDVSAPTLEATLKATAFKECKTNEQFVSAVIVANTYRLNPILKEMYAFPSKGGAVIPIVSVDGWISLINRQADLDGMELIENRGDDGAVESITCKIYNKNRKIPTITTEYMSECCDNTKDTWKRWPIRMLRHKSLIQCARIAFGFSGIYDPDEGERIIQSQEGEMNSSRPDVKMPEEIDEAQIVSDDTAKNEESPKPIDVKKEVSTIAQFKFATPQDFVQWRKNNNYPEKLSACSESQLSSMLNKLVNDE